MRSQAFRLTVVAVAWIALGAAVFFLYSSQQQITSDAAALRTADLHAREAREAIADLRAAQQAYVASGEGVASWVPRATAASETINVALAALRGSATSPAAQSALSDATTSVGELATIDKRARDYIRSGQALMAGDVIFTEGGQAATSTARQVELARESEHQGFEATEAALRKQQAIAIAGAMALAALVQLLLVPVVRLPAAPETIRDAYKALATVDDGIVSHARPGPTAPATASSATRSAPVLQAAADLATDFGRVRDSDELARLLARSAEIMDASGLVVWIGGTAGEDLRPLLAHGYSSHALARMASVPRSADNAAGAAYRTGTLQIVLSRPGGLSGAIVAPILAADGCIGALSAEIRGGGEGSEGVQALAAIIAAHLANVLAAPGQTESAQEAAASS